VNHWLAVSAEANDNHRPLILDDSFNDGYCKFEEDKYKFVTKSKLMMSMNMGMMNNNNAYLRLNWDWETMLVCLHYSTPEELDSVYALN